MMKHTHQLDEFVHPSYSVTLCTLENELDAQIDPGP